MIQSGGTATYNGSLSSIVTNPDGTTTSSGGSTTITFDFDNQTFSGNIDVEHGGFKADVAGNVHKYGFDSTSVTTATESEATGISGSLNGKFYGAEAEAAGGRFNLNSDNAGSVSGVFGIKKE